jgi:predicted nucleotidyltransferase component of viral defense system
MNLTPQAREVAATGFPGETLEKVFRLMSLLDGLNAHPFLKQRVALKSGTALNLFLFDVPRLSVDIDLNYVGTADRDTMLAERPKVDQAVQAVCSREEFVIKRMPFEHAGGKWRLTYASSTGDSGNLELDVNFMLRTPLWPPVKAECHPVGSFRAAPVRGEITTWAERLVAECRDLLSVVLPLTPDEVEFIRLLNDQGGITPELLTDDAGMQATIRDHPGLKWKALNVKKHFGLV